MQKYCNCHNVLTAKESFEGTVDEIKEFIEDPSMDVFAHLAICLMVNVQTCNSLN